jgi:hypothetical protein
MAVQWAKALAEPLAACGANFFMEAIAKLAKPLVNSESPKINEPTWICLLR